MYDDGSYSPLKNRNRENDDDSDSDSRPFITVHRRCNRSNFHTNQVKGDNRPKVVIGSASSHSLKGLIARSSASIFVTRLAPETTADDVKNYIKDVFNISVNCERLLTKYQTYSSFRVDTGQKYIKSLLSSRGWLQ